MSHIILWVSFAVPVFAAESSAPEKVIRVGWYESPFNTTDDFGRRSGYAYEYQQKIAAYTGWKYEYVTGSWSDLLQMLIEGKIDLLSDVSYTEERSSQMLFSSLPMGAEEYYIFVSPDNDTISPEHFSTLNGKKIGINKGSVQVDLFKEWAKVNNVTAEVVELSITEGESLNKLYRGEIDAHVSLDGYYNSNEALPICKIGKSDFYFAISNSRPEIAEELNSAMKRIQNEDPNYNQKLNSKYIKVAGVNLYLSDEEKAWLDDHKTIKVGYQDNYLAFCAKDPDTGELTGALKDYLKVASDSFKNADIEFEPIAYPTAADAMEALTKGEVDCMFPANLTDYDGEVQGFLMTNIIMRTDISAVVLNSVKNSFFKKEHITVAVNAGNPNYEMFLIDNFPNWRSVIFEDTPECLKAISEGKADCILISNYRYNNISKLCDKYGLTSISTGVEIDYSFAVRRDNLLLYSILNKMTEVVPDSTINSALSYYYTEDAKMTFGDMIMQNLSAVIIVFGIIVVLLIALLFYNVKARKKADTSEQLIQATENDPLTGLYSKNFFFEYAAEMFRNDPKKPMDAIVLNIEQFHSINTVHGWEFGDNVIRVLGDAISAFIAEKGGIASHSDGDRFAIYCPHSDNYNELFNRLQNRLFEFSSDSGIKLRMGVMPWETDITPRQQLEQANLACNMSRGRYNEHVVVFDSHIRDRNIYEQQLKNDLDRAIAGDEIEVYYQPKFDIRSDIPELCGAEALVRWNHPDHGLIPPDDFIPLFEQTGQITELDQYVWKNVAADITRWKKEFGKDMVVSVNLSRIDVFDPHLEKNLEKLIKENCFSISSLRLEVTESAYAKNADEMINIIESLKNMGFAIEMDDFGTGYSSLYLLSSMPIDALKIDKAFVKRIGVDDKDDQMVRVILDIAKTLNIPVTAEGVENESQLKILKNLGCDMVQGYYFSRPIPSAEFEKNYVKGNGKGKS